MFQVKPAPAGTQASRKSYQGTTTTSLTGGHTVRLVNGISIQKKVMAITRVTEPSLSETKNILKANNIIIEFRQFRPETANILVVNAKPAAGLARDMTEPLSLSLSLSTVRLAMASPLDEVLPQQPQNYLLS
jgi:hypothetical protein